VHLSVDDFGTGYSSLLQLRHFQVHELKLDRYFVAGLGTNDEDTAIARSVIYLAHALGVKAVAEGVETPSQLALLRELGCDQAQGYSWTRSVPESQLLAWIAPDGRWRARPYLVVTTDAAPGLAERAAPAAKRTNVVLIDDAAGDRRLVRHALERSGSFVVIGEAPDAASGIDLVAAHHPDLALLDLSMPGLGGLEALAGIVGASPETKVVILSGFISPGIADAAMAGGASIYLDKNLPAARLVEELLVLAGAA
jgi:CheY-like chemotaxis protein